jgi:anti-anti-sigma regulatory factor
MAQIIRMQEIGDVAVVSFRQQKIRGEADCNRLIDELFALVGERQKILVDFLGVQFVSVNIVNILITLQKTCRAEGGAFVLCNMAKNVRDMSFCYSYILFKYARTAKRL